MAASKIGLTLEDIQPLLDSLHLYDRYGMDIPEFIITESIRSGEDRLERDLDMLLSPRTIYCITNQDDTEAGPDDIILPPLSKPANWFAGHRQGAVKLPMGPARKILRVTLKPFGPLAQDFDLDLDRVRLERELLRFVPGPLGTVFPLGSIPLSAMLVNDGYILPAGLEIVYEAGLTAHQIDTRFATIKSAAKLAIMLELLVFFQVRLGGGTQKEQLRQDNLDNTVEYASRHNYGPLGGEIKAFEAQYQRLITNIRSGKVNFNMFQ